LKAVQDLMVEMKNTNNQHTSSFTDEANGKQSKWVSMEQFVSL